MIRETKRTKARSNQRSAETQKQWHTVPTPWLGELLDAAAICTDASDSLGIGKLLDSRGDLWFVWFFSDHRVDHKNSIGAGRQNTNLE
jgi:hypothetical protein